MDVGDIGEFGLIDMIRGSLPRYDSRLLVGPGDDAAAWRAEAGVTVATTDTMVAGVHFLPGKVTWRDVGWKALAANVSDIAAMGARPAFALVTLCLPAESKVRDIDELYAGLRECAEAYGVAVAGGDIVSAPVFAITVALMGESMLDRDGSPRLLRRSAAALGDAIAVTGSLGGSAGGLRALLNDDAGQHAATLVTRHIHPLPRLDAGLAAIDAGVQCAIDMSDGLLQDAGHICEESEYGAEIRLSAIPLDPALASAYPDDAVRMAATGGEDYELVLVAPEDVLARVSTALPQPLTIIGRIVEGTGVRVLDAGGAEVEFDHVGWDHLRGAATP